MDMLFRIDQKDFSIKKICPDGNSLFGAISFGKRGKEDYHLEYRTPAGQCINEHQNTLLTQVEKIFSHWPFYQYIEYIQQSENGGGLYELFALSHILTKKIELYLQNNDYLQFKQAFDIESDEEYIRLVLSSFCHYDVFLEQKMFEIQENKQEYLENQKNKFQKNLEEKPNLYICFSF